MAGEAGRRAVPEKFADDLGIVFECIKQKQDP
jgi:hypothetical protein